MMRKLKRAVAFMVMATVFMATPITASAATDYTTPAQIAAELTGRTLQDVNDERLQTGKTYAVMAKDAGKLEDFQTAMLEMRKNYYSELVANGDLTREQADAAYAVIESHHASCDGTGYDSCLLYGTDHSLCSGQGLGGGRGYCGSRAATAGRSHHHGNHH